MSASFPNTVTERTDYPVTAELALVVAALVGVFLWNEIAVGVLSTWVELPSPFDGLVARGLVVGSLLVAGLVAFAWAYASLREVEVGLAIPSRGDLPLVGLAISLPVVLVGVTKLVGDLTGVALNSLTGTSYAANAPVKPFLIITGLGLLVAVPSLVVICQVLVQGSFARVVGDDAAVVLTTVVAGFVLTNGTGGLAVAPERGKLLGAVLFVLALGLALYGRERAERGSIRYLVTVPALLFVALVVLSGVASIGSVAGGLFVTTQVAVLGVAAYAYDRTGSILVPALAYLSLFLTTEAVVFAFGVGLQS